MVNSNETKKSKFFSDDARFSSEIVSLMASKEIKCFFANPLEKYSKVYRVMRDCKYGSVYMVNEVTCTTYIDNNLKLLYQIGRNLSVKKYD